MCLGMLKAWHLLTSAGTWLSSSWPSLSPLALNVEQDKVLETHRDGLRAAAGVSTTLPALPVAQGSGLLAPKQQQQEDEDECGSGGSADEAFFNCPWVGLCLVGVSHQWDCPLSGSRVQ